MSQLNDVIGPCSAWKRVSQVKDKRESPYLPANHYQLIYVKYEFYWQRMFTNEQHAQGCGVHVKSHEAGM